MLAFARTIAWAARSPFAMNESSVVWFCAQQEQPAVVGMSFVS